MASFEKHREESMNTFGKPFKEVHLWLDEFAGSTEYGMKHRKKRHHLKGIQEAMELFGPEAGLAARQHIVTDLREEGWNEQQHSFPRDEQDYVKMGLF